MAHPAWLRCVQVAAAAAAQLLHGAAHVWMCLNKAAFNYSCSKIKSVFKIMLKTTSAPQADLGQHSWSEIARKCSTQVGSMLTPLVRQCC